MSREPFSFTSALKQAIDVCWPRSPQQEPGQHEQATAGVDSAPVRGAGIPAQNSKDAEAVPVSEWLSEQPKASNPFEEKNR